MLVFQAGVGPTEDVEFIDIDAQEICRTTIEQLRLKSYNLNYGLYSKNNNTSIPSNNKYELVPLNDIITLKTGDYITKATTKTGLYPVYGGGGASYYIDKYNRQDKLVIAKDGVSEKCVRFVKGEFFLNHHGWTFDVKDENKAVETFINYWLLENQDTIYNLATGTAQKGINQQSFYDLKIPLPPLEVQQRIVEPIDAWMGMAQAEEKLVENLEKAVMSHIRVIGWTAPRVKLGDVLVQQKGKKYNVSDGKDEGQYPLLRSSKDGKVKWLDTFTFEGPYIAVGTGGIANIHLKKQFNVSTDFIVYDVSDNVMEYVYYQLQLNINHINDNMFQGTTLKHLNRSAFLDYEIPLPPLEKQQYFQPIFDEIKNKKEKIALYKKFAQGFINESIPKC